MSSKGCILVMGVKYQNVKVIPKVMQNFYQLQKPLDFTNKWSKVKLKPCSLFCRFLVSAGNESCPQPQTSEHLAAIEIMKLKHILILQNKIDLVKESQAKEQYDQILKFVQGKWVTCIGNLKDRSWVLLLRQHHCS